jgi:hypothetical protein
MDQVIQNKISYNTKYNYDMLDQFQLDFSIYWGWGITRSQYIAQSFIPSLPNLTKVALMLSHQYTDIHPGVLLSIRSNLNASDLTSIVVDCTDIPYFKELNWTIFYIPDISVVPGNTYYIIVRPYGDVSYACYSTDFLSNDPYSPGEAWLAYWGGLPYSFILA